jgi:sulfide:quinone oxidoreductase
LSEAVADQVDITLIDQSDAFIFGFSKLDVMFGHRPLSQVRALYSDLDKPNLQFRQETVRAIDPVARRVVTDRSTYEPDILVVALGADLDPSATPGFMEGGYEFYSPAGADEVRQVLPAFTSGAVVVGVLGQFFKCPPAPNEAAFMLHDYFRRRGIRDAVDLHLLTPLAMPIPISVDTSKAIVDLLDERRIKHWPQTRVTEVDPVAKVARLHDGRSLPYDLFLGIPVHCAPKVVVESGMCEEGWIPVDAATFETRFPGVYAVGDVTSAPVPRAGVIAEGEAATLADVLIARLTNGDPPAPYAGGAVCYIEMGNEEVARVDVNFLAGAAPTALFHAPSRATAQEKRKFASTRLSRWFGYTEPD